MAVVQFAGRDPSCITRFASTATPSQRLTFDRRTAKKRDDGLYEQDGSSRGAEVVWKAIEAYIALGPKKHSPKTSK